MARETLGKPARADLSPQLQVHTKVRVGDSGGGPDDGESLTWAADPRVPGDNLAQMACIGEN